MVHHNVQKRTPVTNDKFNANRQNKPPIIKNQHRSQKSVRSQNQLWCKSQCRCKGQLRCKISADAKSAPMQNQLRCKISSDAKVSADAKRWDCRSKKTSMATRHRPPLLKISHQNTSGFHFFSNTQNFLISDDKKAFFDPFRIVFWGCFDAFFYFYIASLFLPCFFSLYLCFLTFKFKKQPL